MRKRSGGTGGRSRRTAPQHRSNKTGMRGEENKIVQFGVTGESSGNNNTGNLSLSPLDSFPLCQNKKDNNEIKDASVKSLSLSLLFFSGWCELFSPRCSLTSRSISPVIQQSSFSNTASSTFPKAYALLACTGTV